MAVGERGSSRSRRYSFESAGVQLGVSSRNGKNRTLRPSKDHSTKRKRSRTRLQLVLCDNWHGNAGCLVAQDLALLTKVRSLIHEEILLLTVLYFPFRAPTHDPPFEEML